MAMWPFAGGKWALDVTVAGRQAGHAVSGHSKKAQKKPLVTFGFKYPKERKSQ